MISMASFLTQHLELFQPFVAKWTKPKTSMTAEPVTAATTKTAKTNPAATAATPCSAVRAFFMQANAEDTQLQTKSFDLVTIMYAFHEAPQAGRQRILDEARRLLAVCVYCMCRVHGSLASRLLCSPFRLVAFLQPGGTLAILDISHDYVPSETMLAGEPYILEYQKNIHRQLQRLKGFCHQSPTYKTLVPGRAGVWLLKRSTSAFA